jgi:hypothetical protein
MQAVGRSGIARRHRSNRYCACFSIRPLAFEMYAGGTLDGHRLTLVDQTALRTHRAASKAATPPKRRSGTLDDCIAIGNTAAVISCKDGYRARAAALICVHASHPAAIARTCSTLALSSVSGIVKNWGAWGSMAPPMTVDFMVHLLAATVAPKPRPNKPVIEPKFRIKN